MARSNRKFEIEFRVVNEQAKRARAEEVRGYQDVAKAADKAARAAGDAQARATADSTRRQVVSLQSLQMSGIKVQDQLTRAAQKAADATAREAKRAADAQVRESKRSADAQRKAGDLAGRLAGELQRAAAAGLGLGAVKTVVDGVAESIAKSTANMREFAAATLKAKEDAKELAVLKGLAFADDKFIRQQADYSKKTGLSIAESTDFQSAVIGSAAGGLTKGNIDQATLDKVMVEAGKTAGRQTKDFKTRGDLIGLLPQFRKYDQGDAGVKQVLGDAEAVRLGLTEGRGDDAPLTKSFASVAGSLVGEKGMLPSAPELAALVGVTSLSAGPLAADTRAKQLVRGVRGGTPEQMKFMNQTFGLDEHDNLEKRLGKIVPKLREIEKGGRDIPTFLTENKMPEEQARAIVEMMPNYEVFKKRLEMARQPGKGEQVMADNAAFADSPVGRSRLSSAAVNAAKVTAAMPYQDVASEVDAARARSIESGGETGRMGSLHGFQDFLIGMATFGQVKGDEARMQADAVADLERRTGKKAPGYIPSFDMYPGPVSFAYDNIFMPGYASLTGKSDEDIRSLRAAEAGGAKASPESIGGNEGSPDVVKAIRDMTQALLRAIGRGPSGPVFRRPGGRNTDTDIFGGYQTYW